MNIVLDTNVLVSALISKGFPSKILEEIINRPKINLCLSGPVIKEYQTVLSRPKFSKFPAFVENASIVLLHLQNRSLVFVPKVSVDILSDKSDNKFLELCLESKADYLVTGNSQDFTIKKFKNTAIVSPKDFFENAL